jgi:hypothetical protein
LRVQVLPPAPAPRWARRACPRREWRERAEFGQCTGDRLRHIGGLGSSIAPGVTRFPEDVADLGDDQFRRDQPLARAQQGKRFPVAWLLVAGLPAVEGGLAVAPTVGTRFFTST